MNHPDLFLVSIVRTLVEVALLSLLGQGAVGLLAGARRASNPIYRLFQVVTRPVIRLTRWLAPSGDPRSAPARGGLLPGVLAVDPARLRQARSLPMERVGGVLISPMRTANRRRHASSALHRRRRAPNRRTDRPQGAATTPPKTLESTIASPATPDSTRCSPASLQ
jgi:hypothetical protein